MYIFPFNSTDDDSELNSAPIKRNVDDQYQICCYNPYDSNLEECMGFQGVDPNTNFYIEKKNPNTMDHYITTILRAHTVKKKSIA